MSSVASNYHERWEGVQTLAGRGPQPRNSALPVRPCRVSLYTGHHLFLRALLPSGISFVLLTHMREVQVREEGNEDE